VSRPTTYDEPSWKLYNKLLNLGATVDEATALMQGYAHELADRARAGIALFEDHVGGFQYAREMREIIDVVDPTTPDPEGWDF
jgi:hypothetical protein